MNRSAHRNPRQRRGATIVAMISTMLVIALVLVGLVLGGARDQDLSVRRLETLRAFYAAEAGTNMAIREMMLSTDLDGDGDVGTISNDGNAANDPTVSSGRVYVSKSVVGVQITLSSEGRCGVARRTIETVLQ